MSLLWLRVAVILYAVASLAVLPVALYDRPRWRHVAVPATVAALLFHFVSLAETINAARHRIFGDGFNIASHETQSLLAMILAGAFLGVYARYRTVALGIFLLPITVLLCLVPAFRPGTESAPPLHTGWIFLHVALILAAYAALFLSLLTSLLYLVQERRLKSKSPGPARHKLPTLEVPLETLDQIALKTLLFGLPCMVAGLLIGSLIAVQTIGPAYFRDPKVVLSFAMAFAYMTMIFIRRHSGLRGRRAVYLSSFVFLVALAVWAANQLSAVHRFTAP